MAPNDIREYEDSIQSEIHAFAKEKIEGGTLVSLPGAAGREVTAVDFKHQGKEIRFEVFTSCVCADVSVVQHPAEVTWIHSTGNVWR